MHVTQRHCLRHALTMLYLRHALTMLYLRHALTLLYALHAEHTHVTQRLTQRLTQRPIFITYQCYSTTRVT